jgi:hypothetical protein
VSGAQRFCPRCARVTEHSADGACSGCGRQHWSRPHAKPAPDPLDGLLEEMQGRINGLLYGDDDGAVRR